LIKILNLIADWRVATTDQRHRGHLGCSEIGKAKDCERALWYNFRFCKPEDQLFDARMLRLFETGQLEEQRLLKELRAISINVQDVDPLTNKQWRFATHGGHFSGSCDGIAMEGTPETVGQPTLFEFKTSSAKYFKELVAKGLKEAKFTHYVQMQMYMGLSSNWEKPLRVGIYMATNKDTDEVYSEIVNYDESLFLQYVSIARRIILAKEPLPQCSDSPAFFTCKFCEFHSLCHEEQVPPVNCRTCLSSSPIKDGWKCERFDKMISLEEQRVGCAEHLYIPPLVSFAKPVDAGDDWVEYEQEGKTFFNVTKSCKTGATAKNFLSSEIATQNSKNVLVDDFVQSLKDEFKGMKLI